MPVDPYSVCPGGTGKKIKFCCQELIGDLEQLERLVEGDQLTAALEQVTRLAAKHPGRACLLATQTKLELAARRFNDAAVTSRAFLDAFPDNPLALGHAAITAALVNNMPEAASLLDRAREAAGPDVPPDLVRIAATVVQAAAQAGQTGFAQGVLEWLQEKSLGTDEERRMLATMVASAGVPPAVRTRVHYIETQADSPWRFEFETGLKHVRSWRLGKALTAFQSLRGVASSSPELFTNIALLCEQLARPFEASEAWHTVARLRFQVGGPTAHDDAVEATGRAMTLETQADPDRSPLVRYGLLRGTLQGEIELLEDVVRQNGQCEPSPFDRSRWVSRGAVPPRSVWRIFDAAASDQPDVPPGRLLGTLLVYGRQTDRDAEAVLQGFQPDLVLAQPFLESLLKTTFQASEDAGELPAATPTQWLLGAQFRLSIPKSPPPSVPSDQPTQIDQLLARQRAAGWDRLRSLWPSEPLPELMGRSPRDAVMAGQPLVWRVEAFITENEATLQRPGGAAVWADMRNLLGLAMPEAISEPRPLGTVPPLRWHRLCWEVVELEQLRGLLVTAIDAGFELAAEQASRELLSRSDATAADQWESLSFLEERAVESIDKLEILRRMRELAGHVKAHVGLLDVAELRVRMQRGDQAEMMVLLDRLRRTAGRDQQVMSALAEVLMEAGVDLSALAGGAAPVGAGAMSAAGETIGAAAGKLWTPGGEPAAAPTEKKTLWTPD